MVTEEQVDEVSVIDCREEDGALRDFLRANNRKLFWEDICSELIDNSLEHSGDVCRVTLEWNKAGEFFRAIDDGNGSTDIQAFFKPGKSVQTGRAQGNSTFGVGLFVCECCISDTAKNGILKVATCTGGSVILVGIRRIDKGSNVDRVRVAASDEARMLYGIGYHGTSVTFSRFGKTQPSADDITRIEAKLGQRYASAIECGALELVLIRNGAQRTVHAEPVPQCVDLKSAVIEIGGHTYSVEWGVTTENCRDNGCRMIYGGKFFESAPEPCGDYRIGRFYASIRVPRTIGKESMDILKRTIDHPSIDALFDHCFELFRPELEQSDAICKEGDDEELNNDIAALLSMAIKKNFRKEA